MSYQATPNILNLKTDVDINRFMVVDSNTFVLLESFCNTSTYHIDTECLASNFLEISDIFCNDEIVGNFIKSIPMIEIDVGENYLFLRRYMDKNDNNTTIWSTEILDIIEGESSVLIKHCQQNDKSNLFEKRLCGI